jgi:hypothetical protein
MAYILQTRTENGWQDSNPYTDLDKAIALVHYYQQQNGSRCRVIVENTGAVIFPYEKSDKGKK